ncbi:MAG: nuclear transport factor 2 family protein [Rubrivivax sp.]|nr:nuclear transport factor 2 family protein [Rubrivivax sp.]
MARRPPPPLPADSPDEVEARFYEALQQGELDRLMALWADDDEIVCVHPGGARVVGAAAIRASFETIFASGGIPVRPEQVHRLQQPGFALHHLVERIEVTGEGGAQVGWVLATNVYVKGALGWRIAAHHASTAMPHEVNDADSDGPTTLH